MVKVFELLETVEIKDSHTMVTTSIFSTLKKATKWYEDRLQDLRNDGGTLGHSLIISDSHKFAFGLNELGEKVELRLNDKNLL